MRLVVSLCLLGAAAFAQKPAPPLNPVSLALPDFQLSAGDALRRMRAQCHLERDRQNPLYRGPEACFCLDHPDSVRCKNFSRPGPLGVFASPAYPDDARGRAARRPPAPAGPIGLSTASGPRVAPAERLRFAHPQAALLVGARPAVLLNSPVLAPLMERFGTKETEAMVRELRRVEAFYLSVAPPVAPGQAPDFVALVAGDFSQGVPDLAKSAGGAVEAYWVDRHTILLGSAASARAAHRRLLITGPPASALARQSTARDDTDLWIAADVGRLLKGMAADPKTLLGGQPVAGLDEVRTVAFGLTARDAWTMHADVGVLSAPSAAKLLGQLRAALQKNAGPGEKWIENLELKAEGAHVIVTARLAGEPLRAAVNALARMGEPSPAPGVAAKRRVPPAPAKPVVWGQ